MGSKSIERNLPARIEVKNPTKRQLVAGEQSLTPKRQRDNRRGSDERNQFQEYLDELSEPTIQTAPDEAYGFPQPKPKLPYDSKVRNGGVKGSESQENLVKLPPLEPYQSQVRNDQGLGQSSNTH